MSPWALGPLWGHTRGPLDPRARPGSRFYGSAGPRLPSEKSAAAKASAAARLAAAKAAEPAEAAGQMVQGAMSGMQALPAIDRDVPCRSVPVRATQTSVPKHPCRSVPRRNPCRKIRAGLCRTGAVPWDPWGALGGLGGPLGAPGGPWGPRGPCRAVPGLAPAVPCRATPCRASLCCAIPCRAVPRTSVITPVMHLR